jgi:hypothetical protein
MLSKMPTQHGAWIAAGVEIDADGGEPEGGIAKASQERPPADHRRRVCRRILR